MNSHYLKLQKKKLTKGKNIFHKGQPAADSSKPDRFLHVAIRAGRFMVDAVIRGGRHGTRGCLSARADLRQAIMECGPGPSAWAASSYPRTSSARQGCAGCQSCRRGALLYPDGFRRAFPCSAAASQDTMHALGNRAACTWEQLHTMLQTRYILIRKPKLDSLCIFLTSLVLHMRDFTVGS